MSAYKTPKQVVYKTIKKLAGFACRDDVPIAEEVEAIFKALDENGFIVIARSRNSAALKG